MLLALCLNSNNNYSCDLNTEGDRETMPGLGEVLRRVVGGICQWESMLSLYGLQARSGESFVSAQRFSQHNSNHFHNASQEITSRKYTEEASKPNRVFKLHV